MLKYLFFMFLFLMVICSLILSEFAVNNPQLGNAIQNYQNETLGALNPPELTNDTKDITSSLFVLGVIDLESNDVKLDSFTLLPGVDKNYSYYLNTTYTINLTLKNGSVLANYPFEPKRLSDPTEEGGESAIISEIVPFNPETESIMISFEDKILASREVSQNQPQVRILFPNGGEQFNNSDMIKVKWQTQDSDAGNISSTLLYSPNAGRSWIFIDNNNQNTSGYNISSQNLPGSESAIFRVIASDGVNTAIDDSDIPFKVSFKPPLVHIITPVNNSNYTTIDSVAFEGEVLGFQNASLAEYDTPKHSNETSIFEWSSDKQGILGYGNAKVFTGLAPGNHTITLTAKDVNGLSGSENVQIQIFPVAPVARIERDNFGTVPVNSTVLLNGNNSIGTGQLSYNWTLTEKPGDSEADIANSTQPKIEFLLDKSGNYTVQLSVRDAGGASGLDLISLKANLTNTSDASNSSISLSQLLLPESQ
jgi:hypothetical protein